MNPTMQFSINVAAILLSPLIAVQVTEWIRRRREEGDRRLLVFRTLMTTRGARLAADHVRALNSIDIEFTGGGQKKKAAVEAWRQYQTHLNSGPVNDVWGSRADVLFIDLMHAMAVCLRYDLSKDDIKRTSYFPSGHVEIEDEQNRLRKSLLEITEGKRPLPVKPTTS